MNRRGLLLGGLGIIFSLVICLSAAPAQEASPANAPAGAASPADADGSETGGTATGNSASAAELAESAESLDATATNAEGTFDWKPLAILVLGIAIVLGLIIALKVNAFIALITAAIAVSLMAPGDISEKIGRVATAFGNTAGGIGIVIALAAVIGKCMLDSGAADRIVRFFLRMMGEKQAPLALMGSGYVLAIPVFFDTVFYLLVPLARSLHLRTGKQYLKYILAIAAGGAITHSLVPPTPGPLLMASTLNVDLGVMIMVGMIVALPAAVGGVLFADVADRLMRTPMRQIGNKPDPEPLADDDLPPLSLAVLPVLLPVLLISANTILTTVADMEQVAQLRVEDVSDWNLLQQRLRSAGTSDDETPETRLWSMLPEESQALIAQDELLSDAERLAIVRGLNDVIADREFYSESAFRTVVLSDATKSLLGQDRARMREAVLEHMNRLLLEEAFNESETQLLAAHTWSTPRRRWADLSDTLGNANLALLLSTVIAIWMLARQRGMSRREMAEVVETALMSGGVIILITAGGGAFGAMLQKANIGDSIKYLFGEILAGAGSGMAYLVLGFLLAMVLKIAQGSSTVAMIVGSSMMAAIIDPSQLGFHPVYLATCVGAGSLVGSWMNDSGFWIFAKMGGLTETEALKSWTVMLVFLGLISFVVSLLLSQVMPLV